MNDTERNRFPKSARLSLNKDIDSLFENGQSFISYPLRIVYLPDSGEVSPVSGISILVSVPKKRIKLAVNRNRLKRLIRETYRLNNNEITNCYTTKSKHLHIAFMYVGNDVLPYADIEKAMRKALKILCKKENANP